MRAIMIKTILAALWLLALASPLPAQQPEHSLEASLRAWEISTIATFELDHASFDEAFAKLKQEWQKQHPDLSMPLAVATYDPELGKRPNITMSLKQVPFSAALQYLGEASQQRLARNTAFPRVDLGKEMDHDEGITKTYRITPEVAAKLGLEPGSSRDAIHAALERFGIQFPAWAPASFIRGHAADGKNQDPAGAPELFLILMGEPEQHEMVAGVSRLLEKGFTITPPKQP